MIMEGMDSAMLGLKQFVRALMQRLWDMCAGDESRLPFPATI